jgi:hypothetical protein
MNQPNLPREMYEKVLSRAVQIAPGIKIEWRERPYFVVEAGKGNILEGLAKCPCGNEEKLSVLVVDPRRRAKARIGIRMHHAWHYACWELGLDPESFVEDRDLIRAGIVAGLSDE